MLSLLDAVKMETTIGIIAIVVIVISVGIIIATAVRNFLLQKKMKEETIDENIAEIDVDAQSVGEIESTCEEDNHAVITEEDELAALQTDGIEKEFGDELDCEDEILQEIDLDNVAIDENSKMVEDDMANAKVDDSSMAELIAKMSGDNE